MGEGILSVYSIYPHVLPRLAKMLKGLFHSTLGVQSYSLMMTFGCPITSVWRRSYLGSMLPFSVSVSQDPYRAHEKLFFGAHLVLGGSSQLVIMVIVSPLTGATFHFQMAFLWLINAGDPNYLHSLELTVRPWKLMVGIRSSPFGMAYFRGLLLLVLGRVLGWSSKWAAIFLEDHPS